MANFFLNGLEWLAQSLSDAAAVDAVYQKDSRTYPIKAIVGRAGQELIDAQADLGTSNFDFIIETKYLPFLPDSGDRIFCDGKEFEVANQLDGQSFIFVDSTFKVLRVHTQLVQ